MKINATYYYNTQKLSFKDNIGKNFTPKESKESKTIDIVNENTARPIVNKTTQILFSQDGSAISSRKEDIIYKNDIYTSVPIKAYMPPKPKEAYIYSLLESSENIVSSVIFAQDEKKNLLQTTIKTEKDNSVKIATHDYNSGKLLRETIIKDTDSTDKTIKRETQRTLNEYGLKNVTQFGISTVK